MLECAAGSWAQDDVARHVNKLRTEWRINEVIFGRLARSHDVWWLAWGVQILTFDAAGVSQHPNHIAAHHGVRYLSPAPSFLCTHRIIFWWRLLAFIVTV